MQQGILSLLRDSILPRAKDTLELAKSDYQASNVDIATVLSAQREVLQVEIQVAQVEAELGKALALLERAVGTRINERTLEPTPTEASNPSSPPATFTTPFEPRTPPPAPEAARAVPPEPR